MNAGYGIADITPREPMPLGGFAARCGRNFDRVDDPLKVRALALSGDGGTVVLLAYDLLGVNREVHTRLQARLAERSPGMVFILSATHTHSAPATLPLVGETLAPEAYLVQLEEASIAAAADALTASRPCQMRSTTVDLNGHAYNRRRILKGGRVSMAQEPAGEVMESGPTWDGLHLLALETADGEGICGVAHWAAHPDTVCSSAVTADFPGELCRRLEARHGMPFLYLQGPCANINPPFRQQTREEMLANAAAIADLTDAVTWPEHSQPLSVSFLTEAHSLTYSVLPGREELVELGRGLQTIAETGSGPAESMVVLADILNVEPGTEADPALSQHIAVILGRWCEETLTALDDSILAAGELHLAAVKIGETVFALAGAELFVETGQRLQQRFPQFTVLPVSYTGPVVGYLPDIKAMDQGGYEVDYAYRFYGHPAPFARESEERVVARMVELIEKLASPAFMPSLHDVLKGD